MNGSDDIRDYASPPCYQHQFDDGELIARLNTLLEGERAGALGLIELAKRCADADLRRLLDQVMHDEARFCAMLSRQVARLGGEPTRTTGQFFDKLLARDTLAAQLKLLDRGQSAVVRSLDELLEQPIDLELRRDLDDMRDVHVRNIERCARYLTWFLSLDRRLDEALAETFPASDPVAVSDCR